MQGNKSIAIHNDTIPVLINETETENMCKVFWKYIQRSEGKFMHCNS